MKKIAHFADLHVRLHSRHKEYIDIFNKIFNILKYDVKPDIIVLLGDLGHNPSQMSPEYVDVLSHILNGFSDITTTYITFGNHDLFVNNLNRTDSITPIIRALNRHNIFMLCNSGEYSEPCETDEVEICFNNLSIIDKKNWLLKPSNNNRVNIGLFHGIVKGARTDQNWTLEHSELSVSDLSKFDYVFLGDVHKSNQILDKEGRIRYCGSTIQQNFGETDDKGFLVWSIESKDKFSVEHISVPNPSPFVTIELESDGSIPQNNIIPSNARIRVISDMNAGEAKKIVSKIKKNNKAATCIHIARGKDSKINSSTGQIKKVDLRSAQAQEDLIKDFLKNESQKNIDEVIALNKEIELSLSSEISSTYSNFSIKSLSWNDLFIFGPDNNLDFAKLSGLTGLFGPNHSGKSSVVDVLLFSIFGNVSKTLPAGNIIHIINHSSNKASSKVELCIDEFEYTIERKISKVKRKDKIGVKSEINFFRTNIKDGNIESLNSGKNGTENKIEQIFGCIRDFLMTSVSSQFGNLDFINTKSTGRKEIMAKFLNLEFFERKYELVNKKSSANKIMLAKLQKRDYKSEISEISSELKHNNILLEEKKNELKAKQERINDINQDILELQFKINNADVNFINIDSTKAEMASIKSSIEVKTKLLENKKNKRELLEEMKQNYDEFDLSKKIEHLEEKRRDIEIIQEQIALNDSDKSKSIHKLKILDNIPCNNQFPSCEFIKEANDSHQIIENANIYISQAVTCLQEINDEIAKVDEKCIRKKIKKVSIIKKNINKLNNDIQMLEIEYTSLKNKYEILTRDISDYERNKAIIDNLKPMKEELENKNQALSSLTADCAVYQNVVEKLFYKKGVLNNSLEEVSDSKREYEKLKNDYKVYELYLKCMHSNGIPFEIIKQTLPVVNNEINKILSNIVNFEIILSNDQDKLNILLRKPDGSEGHLELACGMEKEMAAMAIRIAFLQISALPKSNLFILDEPATMLDDKNMQGFIQIIEIIKNYFDTILMISHNDTLKDKAETLLSIQMQNNVASINI